MNGTLTLDEKWRGRGRTEIFNLVLKRIEFFLESLIFGLNYFCTFFCRLIMHPRKSEEFDFVSKNEKKKRLSRKSQSVSTLVYFWV